MAESDPRQEAAEQAGDQLHASHYDAGNDPSPQPSAQQGEGVFDPRPRTEGKGATPLPLQGRGRGRGPSPVPPEEFTGLELKPPARSAGGFPAVLNSLSFA